MIATGDGKQREFALIKMYTVGEHSQIRRIQKPVENTVVVAINGVTDPRFTVNTVNGLVVLSEEYDPPQPDDIITAGFEFDVPCRFDTDQLTIGLHHQTLGSFTIPLVEMRFF